MDSNKKMTCFTLQDVIENRILFLESNSPFMDLEMSEKDGELLAYNEILIDTESLSVREFSSKYLEIVNSLSVKFDNEEFSMKDAIKMSSYNNSIIRVLALINPMYEYNLDNIYATDEDEQAKILDWSNATNESTYGDTFIEHGSHHQDQHLISRARANKQQYGQWTNDQLAADFIAEIAQKRGVGTHDVTLPNDLPRRLFLANGVQAKADMARIIVNLDGSVRTAFPFSSKHPH